MNALRFVVIGLSVAAAVILSSGGAVLAQNIQVVSRSGVAIDYEGSPVVTYSIVNAWPRKP